MDIKKVLTEAECGRLGEEAIQKLENAYRSELGKALKDENDKSAAKFEALVKSVGERVDEKVGKAVTEAVGRMKTDAITSKLYSIVQNMANLLEQAGIPATEVTKRLQQELKTADENLKQAYVDREEVKKKLNYQSKINLIYELTAGSSPDVINSVIEHFKNSDIREIDKNSIADFIDGNASGETMLLDVDVDSSSPLNMDKVEAALNEIQDSNDMDMSGFLAIEDEPAKPVRPKLTESVASKKRKPQKLERVMMPSSGVSDMAQLEAQSPDVADAMRQMAAFESLGFGGRFL